MLLPFSVWKHCICRYIFRVRLRIMRADCHETQLFQITETNWVCSKRVKIEMISTKLSGALSFYQVLIILNNFSKSCRLLKNNYMCDSAASLLLCNSHPYSVTKNFSKSILTLLFVNLLTAVFYFTWDFKMIKD